MTPVTLVGMIAGGILILAAVVVFLTKKEFPSGGVMITMVGLVLIGMSQWSSFKISAAGATLEVVRGELRDTAAAAAEVATQVQQTAAAVEATKQQLASLAGSLQTRNVLPAAVAQPIQSRLSAIQKADLSRLSAARSKLEGVMKP